MTYQWQGSTLILDCHLQPKAKHNEFCGVHGDAFKIRITAPPVDGKANAHLVKFLANAFGVTQAQVTLLSGQNSRKKRLAIDQPTTIPTELGIESQRSDPP